MSRFRIILQLTVHIFIYIGPISKSDPIIFILNFLSKLSSRSVFHNFFYFAGVEVNLGHMMISHGYALPTNDDFPRAMSPYNTSRSNSNDALTSSTSSSIQPLVKSNSPHPPMSPSYSNETDSAEDALIEEQLKHLKTTTPFNKFLNGNSFSAAKMSPSEFLNGNSLQAAATITAPSSNGHHVPLESSSVFNGNPQR